MLEANLFVFIACCVAYCWIRLSGTVSNNILKGCIATMGAVIAICLFEKGLENSCIIVLVCMATDSSTNDCAYHIQPYLSEISRLDILFL